MAEEGIVGYIDGLAVLRGIVEVMVGLAVLAAGQRHGLVVLDGTSRNEENAGDMATLNGTGNYIIKWLQVYIMYFIL